MKPLAFLLASFALLTTVAQATELATALYIPDDTPTAYYLPEPDVVNIHHHHHHAIPVPAPTYLPIIKMPNLFPKVTKTSSLVIQKRALLDEAVAFKIGLALGSLGGASTGAIAGTVAGSGATAIALKAKALTVHKIFGKYKKPVPFPLPFPLPLPLPLPIPIPKHFSLTKDFGHVHSHDCHHHRTDEQNNHQQNLVRADKKDTIYQEEDRSTSKESTPRESKKKQKEKQDRDEEEEDEEEGEIEEEEEEKQKQATTVKPKAKKKTKTTAKRKVTKSKTINIGFDKGLKITLGKR